MTRSTKSLSVASTARKTGAQSKNNVKSSSKSVLIGARLSDPLIKASVDKHAKELATTRGKALSFLQGIGIATPTGRLSKKYGG